MTDILVAIAGKDAIITQSMIMTISPCKIIAKLVFLFCGLLFIGISIPLILEKIPPNRWYGFRTRKTLSNKEIWYKANKYMGRDFVILGGLVVLYNLVLFIFKPPFLSFEPTGNLILVNSGVLVVLVRSVLYLKKL